jgi:hypothetical protein
MGSLVPSFIVARVIRVLAAFVAAIMVALRVVVRAVEASSGHGTPHHAIGFERHACSASRRHGWNTTIAVL